MIDQNSGVVSSISRQDAALNVFRESIDLAVPNFIKIHHSSFREKAVQMVDTARPFIDIAKSVYPQIESEIQHSISPDGNLELESEQSLDYQMVLEQDSAQGGSRTQAWSYDAAVVSSVGGGK